jgi:ADP-ribose pyrophosphatase YjhB (NUDIX family)
MYNMVAASILPIAFHNGEIYFLFGKENEMEDSAKGFSDFGGRVEGRETLMQTALREGSEEMCGFFGGPEQLKARIKRGGGTYKIAYTNDEKSKSSHSYNVHVFQTDFDENLPVYFTNNHRFLWKCMDKHLLNDSKLFEKQEIRWFSPTELRRGNVRGLFRPFYREILDLVLEHESKIRAFFTGKKMNKTRKNTKNGGGNQGHVQNRIIGG